MTVIAAKVELTKITMSCDSRITRGYHGKNTGYQEKIIEVQTF